VHKFAEVLATCGGLADRLARLHTAGGDGRCMVCSGPGGMRPLHPCTIQAVASQALRLQARGPVVAVLIPSGPEQAR
jgi:hypothetical protein